MPEIVIKDGQGSTIKYYEFKGKHFPIFPTIEENLQNLPDMNCRDDDVTIITYPKSGTHWTWEIANMLYTQNGECHKHKVEGFLEMMPLNHFAELPSIRLLNTHLTPEFYPKDLVNRKCKVVYVQRNPKDVFASFYHFTYRTKLYKYDGDWNGFFDMILDGKSDYGSWFDYTKQWEDFFSRHPDIPVLRLYYEDMKLDIRSEIQKIAHFLDMPCSSAYSDKVAEKCGFDVMKKEKIFPKKIMEENFKGSDNPVYRKGIIGDWKNHFTVSQNERFDAEYRKQMMGFAFKFEQYM